MANRAHVNWPDTGKKLILLQFSAVAYWLILISLTILKYFLDLNPFKERANLLIKLI